MTHSQRRPTRTRPPSSRRRIQPTPPPSVPRCGWVAGGDRVPVGPCRCRVGQSGPSARSRAPRPQSPPPPSRNDAFAAPAHQNTATIFPTPHPTHAAAIRAPMRLGCRWLPSPGGPALRGGGSGDFPGVDSVSDSSRLEVVRSGPPYVSRPVMRRVGQSGPSARSPAPRPKSPPPPSRNGPLSSAGPPEHGHHPPDAASIRRSYHPCPDAAGLPVVTVSRWAGAAWGWFRRLPRR